MRYLIAAVVVFLAIAFIAQQIMDIHYVRTGETWEEKVKHLNKKHYDKQKDGIR